jgi:hypothetical protein
MQKLQIDIPNVQREWGVESEEWGEPTNTSVTDSLLGASYSTPHSSLLTPHSPLEGTYNP